MSRLKVSACSGNNKRRSQRLYCQRFGQILNNALAFYKKNKYLIPKDAFVVLWRLQHNSIDHSPTFFKVRLKKDKYQANLKQMETSRVHLIWPALSSSQRKMAIELGHSESPTA